MPRSTHTLETLQRRFGVTRLARVTQLDRPVGVEVYAAIRPRGHVLQVSQGKGLTVEAAKWSALGEAIELSAAETVDVGRLRFGPAPEHHQWTVGDERVAWIDAVDLRSGKPSWVPAQEVVCPPAGQVWLGPVSTSWRSNGLGFHHRDRQRAVEHAVGELVERDALAHALPSGWLAEHALPRLCAPTPLMRHLEASGFAAFLFNLTVGKLPVAGALLFDLEHGPVPLTAGYACRRDFAAAAEAALLEAVQSRLTEIHGAREDVLGGHREAGASLLRTLRGLEGRARPPPVFRGALAQAVEGELHLVTLCEHPWVVKAVSPTCLVSELL